MSINVVGSFRSAKDAAPGETLGTGIVWGLITNAPRTGTGRNGAPYCAFYLKYGTKAAKNPTDKPESISVLVRSFGKAAESAIHLEKGDLAVCLGKLTLNEYNGKRSPQFAADMVFSPSFQSLAAGNAAAIETLQFALKCAKEASSAGNASTDAAPFDGGTVDPETGEVFSDIDVNVDDVFPDF